MGQGSMEKFYRKAFEHTNSVKSIQIQWEWREKERNKRHDMHLCDFTHL